MFINARNFILVLLANFGFQYLSFKHLRIFDIAPDFTLLFIVFYSASTTEATCLLAAFGLGLCQDLLLRSPLGGHSLGYLIVAYIASRLLAGRIDLKIKNTFLTAVYFAFLFSLIYENLVPPVWGANLLWKPAVFSLYSGLWSVPAFYFYRKGLA